jgi:hypothetical protein
VTRGISARQGDDSTHGLAGVARWGEEWAPREALLVGPTSELLHVLLWIELAQLRREVLEVVDIHAVDSLNASTLDQTYTWTVGTVAPTGVT